MVMQKINECYLRNTCVAHVYFDNSLIAQRVEPPLDAGIKPPLGSRFLVTLGLNFEVFLAESLRARFFKKRSKNGPNAILDIFDKPAIPRQKNYRMTCSRSEFIVECCCIDGDNDENAIHLPNKLKTQMRKC
jgi:hypothetical protein